MHNLHLSIKGRLGWTDVRDNLFLGQNSSHAAKDICKGYMQRMYAKDICKGYMGRNSGAGSTKHDIPYLLFMPVQCRHPESRTIDLTSVSISVDGLNCLLL